MNRLPAVALLLGAAIGCTDPAAPPAPGPGPVDPGPADAGPIEPAGPPIVVTPLEIPARLPLEATATATTTPGGTWKLDEVRTIALELVLKRAEGPLTVVLELQAPGGVPFERRERQVVAELASELKIGFDVPVAGTVIQQARLSGTWTASYLVEGRPVVTQQFTLVP